MADQNGSVTQEVSEHTEGYAPVDSKGKGKAVEQPSQDMSMDEDDSSENETGAEEDEEIGDADEEEDDPNEGLDLNEIVGSRTRGKQIDFAKAAEDQGDDLEDDDDDDEDFESDEEEGKDGDAMEL
ncbi:MAG: hypothetical protein M4579_006297 [Chaenotheca gracillima]|nr:MAG: hypothetical protein M4579_006297 [Chaenotheca gracillima]